MQPQLPPEKKPYKNGVDHGRRRGSFEPRSWSFLWRAKLEAVVAVLVIGGVVAVFVYLVQIPGALVVRLMDDKHQPVAKAQTRCHHAESGLSMSGQTDVFGEVKFPGMQKGVWTCEVQPPDRFFSPLLTGSAKVSPRYPAAVELTAPRGVEVEVFVQRPDGAPRDSPAVRAVCAPSRGLPASGWEARAGLLDSTAILHLPRDSACNVGLLPGAPGWFNGPPDRAELDCTTLPCAPVTGQPGARVVVRLKPTRAQWDAARPPPEPDEAEDAGPKSAPAPKSGRP